MDYSLRFCAIDHHSNHNIILTAHFLEDPIILMTTEKAADDTAPFPQTYKIIHL